MLCALAALVATPASARPTRLQRAEAIADSYYPTSPCHGRTVVIPVGPARIVDYWHGTSDMGAVSTPVGCRIEIDWTRFADQPWRVACRLLVHEYGHLAGLGHSPDRSSVMYEQLFDIAQGSERCWTAFYDSENAIYSRDELAHARAVRFLRAHPHWHR